MAKITVNGQTAKIRVIPSERRGETRIIAIGLDGSEVDISSCVSGWGVVKSASGDDFDRLVIDALLYEVDP